MTAVPYRDPERATGGGVPQGMHTCKSGRADGASWVFTDDFWFCPFCREHGIGFDDEGNVVEPDTP